MWNCFFQTQSATHPVREDCLWPSGWPDWAGNRSRTHIFAPASGSSCHARCNSTDGHAAVHQQWTPKSGSAIHHPLWPSYRGPDRRSPRSTEGKGEWCHLGMLLKEYHAYDLLVFQTCMHFFRLLNTKEDFLIFLFFTDFIPLFHSFSRCQPGSESRGLQFSR